jgi:hypothetical protein
MNIPVHPAGVMLRGDERYNPRFTREPEYRADGGSRITGVMRPDSPEGVAANPTLPELPFRFIVPADADYTPINVEVWRRLQSGETLWDLNFAPSSPAPSQSAASSGASASLLLGAISLGAILGLASSSRS